MEIHIAYSQRGFAEESVSGCGLFNFQFRSHGGLGFTFNPIHFLQSIGRLVLCTSVEKLESAAQCVMCMLKSVCSRVDKGRQGTCMQNKIECWWFHVSLNWNWR
jgi:hypothetical protein